MEQTKIYLALIPLLPLLGSVLAYLTGLRIRSAAGLIATLASSIAFGMTVVLFLALPDEGFFESNLFNWFTVGGLKVDFVFRFDHLTAVMCLVVTGIGSLIHLYSTSYMSEDEGRHRFFAYLNLFMFSMLLLVLGGNLLVLFVGWEGVGLCSYLLIGFWYKNINYAAAGKKAFVVNRIGDAGFLAGVFLLFSHFGSLDFLVLSQAISGHTELTVICTLIALCLFVGATGKSAQIPLFVWLPDAMAGPTPVSALIHAATMVTAGVYMFARMNFLFSLAPFAMFVVCIVAVLTAFVAATIAMTQNDIKKVLAYSTVSQLGFMFIGASVGAYDAAVFHLVTHAFFKACLFLGAGSVIHGCHHEQDMREMGGLSRLMPVTFATYLISTLAIAGIFPLAGYYSKHSILNALKVSENSYIVQYADLFFTLATLTAFLTAFYMTRSLVMTFFGRYRGHAHPHESPLRMTLPLVVLAFLALCGGVFLNHRLPHYLSEVMVVHAHGEESIIDSIVGSWVGVLGVVLALLFYVVMPTLPAKIYASLGVLGRLSSGKYYIDEIYAALVVRPLQFISRKLWSGVDQLVIDGAVNGTASAIEMSGEVARQSATGQIRDYAIFMFLSAILLIVFYLVL